MTLREKCPYTPSLSVFSPNARKYRPEKLHIRTLFTQCVFNDWIPNLDLIWISCAYHQTEAICFIFHLIILKPFKWLFGWKSFGNNINVVTDIIKGIVISITSKVNIIQNKKNKRNWERKRTDHWEICWTKQALTLNLEALEKEFTPRNFHWFLFFDSLENYLWISKLLDETHIHLILLWITCGRQPIIIANPLNSAPNGWLLSTACFPISHIADGQCCAI